MQGWRHTTCAVLALPVMLAACSAQDKSSDVVAANQLAPALASPMLSNDVQVVADTPAETPVPADDWAGEPDDAFYDACLLARFPAGGFVRVGQARAGDFIATISGGDTGIWEPDPDEDRSFIYRIDKQDRLTRKTTSVAVDLRQTNTPPIEGAACGPRAVVVTAVARDGQRATPMQTYAGVRQMGSQAQRNRDSGALGVTPYHEPATTDGDDPYTEAIVSEQSAINRGIAREMGGAR